LKGAHLIILEMDKKKRLNPFTIIVFWMVGCVLFTIVGMILSGISTSGGEQIPFTFFSNMIPVTIYGVLALSIITIPFYIKWVKEKWFINLFFIVFCCLFIYKDRMETKKIPDYSFSVITQTVNNREYEKKIEYYGHDFARIRSISFTLNNKKDSIWTTYAENGSIIKQEKYKADLLVELIK
jgi:hypothetical protein